MVSAGLHRRGIAAGEGDARLEFPVNPGEVWAVGSHLLVCDDIEAGSAERLRELAGPPDVIWTDPPWSSAQARMYRTVARADGPKGRAVQWSALAQAMVEAWSHCPGDVWAQLGTREGHTAAECDAVIETVKAAGGQHLWTSETIILEAPSSMLLFRWTPRERETLPTGRFDCYQAPSLCLEASDVGPGDVVTDFCFGAAAVGPLAAVGRGARFVGAELSPGRMAMALRRMATLTDEQPRHVSPRQARAIA